MFVTVIYKNATFWFLSGARRSHKTPYEFRFCITLLAMPGFDKERFDEDVALRLRQIKETK